MTALAGKSVVVTRAVHQSRELVEGLRTAGAIVIEYPCIDILPPQDTSALDTALMDSGSYDWLILSSVNVVEALAMRAESLGIQIAHDDGSGHGPRVAVVGPKTAQAARESLNLSVDFMPESSRAQALATALPVTSGDRIFLPQSEIGRDELATLLGQRGAVVTRLAAYRTVLASEGEPLTCTPDAVTFTSGSTVRGFVRRWQKDGRALRELHELLCACIGPVTQQDAIQAGFKRTLAPQQPGLAGMIAGLEAYFGEHQP